MTGRLNDLLYEVVEKSIAENLSPEDLTSYLSSAWYDYLSEKRRLDNAEFVRLLTKGK